MGNQTTFGEHATPSINKLGLITIGVTFHEDFLPLGSKCKPGGTTTWLPTMTGWVASAIYTGTTPTRTEQPRTAYTIAFPYGICGRRSSFLPICGLVFQEAFPINPPQERGVQIPKPSKPPIKGNLRNGVPPNH